MINKCIICGKDLEAVESREACCSEACKEEYVYKNRHILYNSDYVLDKYGNPYVPLGSDIREDYYDLDGWHHVKCESIEERKEKLRSKWGALYK